MGRFGRWLARRTQPVDEFSPLKDVARILVMDAAIVLAVLLVLGVALHVLANPCGRA